MGTRGKVLLRLAVFALIASLLHPSLQQDGIHIDGIGDLDQYLANLDRELDELDESADSQSNTLSKKKQNQPKIIKDKWNKQQLDQISSALKSALKNGDKDLDVALKNLNWKIEFETRVEGGSQKNAHADGHNLKVDYLRISDYLLENSENQRGVDFFNCGLRAVIGNPEGRITRVFIQNLINIWHNKYEHSPNLEPLGLCYFDKEFLQDLEDKLKTRINFARVFSGHDNILFASELLSWLSQQGIHFRDHMVAI